MTSCPWVMELRDPASICPLARSRLLPALLRAVAAKGHIDTRFVPPFFPDRLSWPLAALAAVLVGGLGGLTQGLIVSRLSVPSFVATLGGMTVFRGLTLIVGNGGPIAGFDPDFGWWGRGLIGPVPVPPSRAAS